VPELHEALLLWIVARQAFSTGARAIAPLVDPSSEPFPPLV
jgi:hypothetical protein